jgi:riboflavin kinase/FMN adenylyltransferase
MPADSLSITVLGSGTSVGVPTIGCHCAVCHSDDPRDRRLRPSILISYGGRNVLIDTTPDFRYQALRAGIERIDAILFTHSHADHVMGLDDVRPVNFRQGGIIPIYGSAETIANIRRSFRYIFDEGETESSRPHLDVNIFDSDPFELFGLEFQPLRLAHGSGVVHGFRFGDAAYLTDHSDIPPESMARLKNLRVLFLDALRHRPHPTHSTVARSLQSVEQLAPERTWFTHICHDLPHAATEESLPPHVRLAYDGLKIHLEPTVPCAVTIGNFDGLHIGHRGIMRRVVEVARAHGWKAAAVTFDPHPTRLVAPERAPRLLTTPEQRCELMRQEGIEQILILPFTAEIARLSPEEFVRQILVEKLDARAVLVGENFRFGHRAAGDFRTLRDLGQQYGFETQVVEHVHWRKHLVSSSEIRRAIADGRVSLACRMLGRPYALEGSVVHGEGIGSKQTVPTLNLDTAAEVLPAHGVYVTRTHDLEGSRQWPSITNIGVRPTFNGHKLTVETFLLAPLEGETPRKIRVEFLRWVRSERKFEDAVALKTQIMRDVGRAQSYFRRLDIVGRSVRV